MALFCDDIVFSPFDFNHWTNDSPSPPTADDYLIDSHRIDLHIEKQFCRHGELIPFMIPDKPNILVTQPNPLKSFVSLWYAIAKNLCLVFWPFSHSSLYTSFFTSTQSTSVIIHPWSLYLILMDYVEKLKININFQATRRIK